METLLPAHAPAGRRSTYPWGWFVVALEHELEPGRVLPMSYFGMDLVAFRAEDGTARVASGRCPCCGFRFEPEDGVPGGVQCPRSRVRFDGEGLGAPALGGWEPRLRGLPTHASHGFVFAWYHPTGGKPSFAIPPVVEHGKPGWLDWEVRCLEIATHPREIVENVVDFGHFIPVHQTDPKRFENAFPGHLAIQRAEGLGSSENKYAGDSYRLVATYHGPGYQVTEFESRGLSARLVNAHTMIAPNRLHLRFGVLLQDPGDPKKGERFRRAYVDDLQKGFAQDVAIWEHKVYRDHPVLCDGDGPIGELRRWYAQFYVVD
ncbi:MAG: hypothetical protein U0230_21130 [Polyangiales bacterium]